MQHDIDARRQQRDHGPGLGRGAAQRRQWRDRPLGVAADNRDRRRHELAVGIDDRNLQQVAALRDPRQDRRGTRGVAQRLRTERLQRLGDLVDVVHDRGAHRVDGGIDDGPGAVQPLAQPVADIFAQADAEPVARHHGDDKGGRHGEQAEQQHQPQVQARAGDAAAALDEKACQPADDHAAQGDDDAEVDREQRKRDAARGEPVRQQPGQRGIGERGRHDRQRGEAIGHGPAREQPAEPAEETLGSKSA